MKKYPTGKACSILGLLVLLLAAEGCSTAVEKSAELLKGSAFDERVISSYRILNPKTDSITAVGGNPTGGDSADSLASGITVKRIGRLNGGEYITISVDRHPNMVIRGSGTDSSGYFYLESLYFLSPNLMGWNEFTRELTGTGIFREEHGLGVIKLDDPQILDIVSGKIRRNSTRLREAEALTSLRNRQERVEAIVSWMQERELTQEQEQTQAHGPQIFPSQGEFESHWKPILFPELVHPRERPQEWEGRGTEWVTAGDIRWNSGYTAAVFPEELHAIRNSGTLLRDWEEAAAWLYFQFELDSIIESLTDEIHLIQEK
jgi:hypothetical protein